MWYEWAIKEFHEDWILWLSTKNHRPVTWVRTEGSIKAPTESERAKRWKQADEAARASLKPYAAGSKTNI